MGIDIQIILEMSALVALISAVISYITFRKSSGLTYVTQERKEWRDSIRLIAEKLETCTYKKRHAVLVQLKTRINAYGMEGDDEIQDAHIWKMEQKMETCTKEEFDCLRKEMILYLAALLKYDWERSKKEVYGNVIKVVGLVFLTMALFLFVLEVKTLYGEGIEETLPLLCTSLLLVGGGVLVTVIWKKVSRIYFRLGYVAFAFRWVLIAAIYASGWYFVGRIGVYIQTAFVAIFFAAAAMFWVEFEELFEEKKYSKLVQSIIGDEKKENNNSKNEG